ncbi:endopeptidase La [Oceanospirillaceae bacterium]|jgi:ATP-dependent Lon protease|nr:endopeptidase La [Oceanospirillaceae bacterium]MBT6100149.1 endopeptidase La [Oceanospirillaceae bacterium]MDB0064937.1 endopeptidase La [Oceanospirillaceae bacterium]
MTQSLPLIPLRDVVVYPHMVIPLFVGRQNSIDALEHAMAADKAIVVVAQKSATVDDPKVEDLFEVGTSARILQLLKLPDGTVKVLVEGEQRVKIKQVDETEGFFTASVLTIDDAEPSEGERKALAHTLMAQFEQYVKLSKKISSDVMSSITNIDDPSRLADTIASQMNLKLEEKQHLLEMGDLTQRLERLMGQMEGEIDLVKVEKRIRGRVKKQMEKSQREYYLNEQIKAIQKELGDIDDAAPNDLEELQNKINNAGMPAEAKEKSQNELNKLKNMSPMSAEATVVRSYIDWMVTIPWKKKSRLKHDLAKATSVLEEDHYGLSEVKERILEYLAVQQRVKKVKGSILCLVGPPGVGKTSLGKSIARATGRQYVRMALGGVRDEAEIRGHRRTYIGSLPGKLVQKMSKVGVANPLFLLDEIDKMGMDSRGDPASALLEVLDPEQNNTFNDHYLEVDYDLSSVMFVCTANTMNIPGPLLDRMEIIRIPGYTEDEKLSIAKRYLLTKQLAANGLSPTELALKDDAIVDLIRYYTREAGVRSLEREIAKICRKVVKEHLLSGHTTANDSPSKNVNAENLELYSGVRKHSFGQADVEDRVGHVNGLAWTSVGGDILTIESAVVPGKGRLVKTGSLGDVMQESIQAALTVVRGRASGLGIKTDFHEKTDIHIHVPEGATPKDGPSAGVGMCTALVSVLTGIPVRADVAMTGEITLRGQVLPIGGLKEKLLAAHRGGIKTIIIPEENERDLKEIPDNIKADLSIKPVKWIDEVLDLALQFPPTALLVDEGELGGDSVKKVSGNGVVSTH